MTRTTRLCCSRLLIKYAVALACMAFFLSGCSNTKTGQAKEVRIAVLTYDEYDTLIESITKEMTKWARQKEKENGVRITLDIVGARKSQLTQNDQARKYITGKYDVLCVNLVDRTDATVIIDKAMASDTPVIFFNREPVEEDLSRWDKLYYVGASAHKGRRMGVVLCYGEVGDDVNALRDKAKRLAKTVLGTDPYTKFEH